MIPTKTRPHEPLLAEWTSKILSLSLSCPGHPVNTTETEYQSKKSGSFETRPAGKCCPLQPSVLEVVGKINEGPPTALADPGQDTTFESLSKPQAVSKRKRE